MAKTWQSLGISLAQERERESTMLPYTYTLLKGVPRFLENGLLGSRIRELNYGEASLDTLVNVRVTSF